MAPALEGTPTVADAPVAAFNKQASSRDWRGKNETVEAKVGKSGEGLHSFSAQERAYLCGYINTLLRNDADLKDVLPIEPKSNKIFEIVSDGTFLCKLLNQVVPDALDTRALNIPGKKGSLNAWEIQENHNLFINSATACGCSFLNIGPADLQKGTEHLVLSAIWQVIKLGLLDTISLSDVPELAVLAGPDEDLEDLHMMPPDQVLLRWLNYHLTKSGVWKQPCLDTYGGLADCLAYIILFNQLEPTSFSLQGLEMPDAKQRAEMIVKWAKDLGVHPGAIPSIQDLCRGNEKLTLAFLASLFHAENGLKRYLDSRTRESVFNFQREDDQDITREERTMRTWINSLGCTTHCKHLFDSLKDGFLLLEILEKLKPGVVNWKKVHKPPVVSAFRKIENCVLALKLAETECNVTLVCVAGLDITERNKKSTLAVVWQLMRFHSLSLLKSWGIAQGNEQVVLSWANDTVQAAGSERRLSGFADNSASDSRFLLDLLKAVAPKMVDEQYIANASTAGDDEEAKKLNAKYVISTARKLGCVIFLSWEDIVDCRQKMIFSLVACIMATIKQRDAILK